MLTRKKLFRNGRITKVRCTIHLLKNYLKLKVFRYRSISKIYFHAVLNLKKITLGNYYHILVDILNTIHYKLILNIK